MSAEFFYPNGAILLHDNGRPYSAAAAVEVIKQLKIKFLQPPPPRDIIRI
jgi:hypothetical protein